MNGGDDYDRLAAGEPAVVAWITFLEHWQEGRTMAQIDYPPVEQALEHLKRLSTGEETQPTIEAVFG